MPRFGLVASAATLAIAQAPSQDVISALSNNQAIFVDKASFNVVKGNAKGDPGRDPGENGR